MDLFPQFAIWSGGQTGVDQGALEAAIERGIPHGGWCPKGRRCETGVIPARFLLTEHASAKYPPRTEKNILDTQGTLILGWGSFHAQGPGTKLTRKIARRVDKPYLYQDLQAVWSSGNYNEISQEVLSFLSRHSITRLNVAGPRESTYRGVQTITRLGLGYVLDMKEKAGTV
jgi:hypothetical protein